MVNIYYEEHGRGAWSKEGGLLQLDRTNNITKPGPYYMAPVNSTYMIGKATAALIAQNKPVAINFYATFLAVKQLQKRLNAILPGTDLVIDGILGPKTDASIKALQKKLGVVADGMIGPNTSAAVFVPIVQEQAAKLAVGWENPAGIIKKECGFDMGAVGYVDTHDLGVGQINMISHPEITPEQAFDHVFAIDYVIKRYKKALIDFGNERDAIASYNLGYGGTREWIKAGRPAIWTPSWDIKPRNTKEYIDQIVNAY